MMERGLAQRIRIWETDTMIVEEAPSGGGVAGGVARARQRESTTVTTWAEGGGSRVGR